MINQKEVKENEWLSPKIVEMMKNGEINDYVMLRLIKCIRYTHAVFFKIRVQGNVAFIQGFAKDRLVCSETAKAETSKGKVKDMDLILIKNLVYKNGYVIPTIDYKLMTLDEAIGLI